MARSQDWVGRVCFLCMERWGAFYVLTVVVSVQLVEEGGLP